MYSTRPVVLLPGLEAPRFYSPLSDTLVTRGGNLPHWEQHQATVFVTFRLSDSLPQGKLDEWKDEEAVWLAAHPEPWCEEVRRLHDELFCGRMEEWLDRGHGSCALKDPVLRAIVEDRLRYFDGVQYRLYAFAVMPNHVHVVFMPYEGFAVASIVQAWKSVSARLLAQTGFELKPVWQREYFDRYIRNGEHFDRAMRYTKRNDESISWWACEG